MESSKPASSANSVPSGGRGAIDRIIGLFGTEQGGELREVAPSDDQIALDKIGHFILTRDLGVTPTTLTSAHDFVRGDDLQLVRKIREREDAGEPVTRIWLESMSSPAHRNAGVRKLDKVIEHLETNVELLSSAASTARHATHDYNNALEENERQLSEGGAADVTQVVGLVRQMIGQARQLERQLNATEAESQKMRADLKRARKLADLDHLTGLPNRRAFEQRLDEARQQLDVSHSVCLGFCDIDHFKKVNDVHGHDTGDRVLKLVAEHLSYATGNDCFVARHGGEEFALLFDGLSVEEACKKLDSARQALSERRLKDRRTGKSLGMVTFSAGIARCDIGAEPGAALKAADEALYAAKQQGRNRIMVSGVGG